MSFNDDPLESVGEAGQGRPVTDRPAALQEFARALTVCRDALTRDDANASYAMMREPIATLASMGCRAGVPPERVVADLKELLSRLPTFQAKDVLERSDMMGQVVTLAITSYFAKKAD